MSMRVWPILLLCLAGGTRLPAQTQAGLVWPAPPEQERIRYMGSISSDADLGVERSFLGKIWDAIVGAESEQFRMVQPLGVAVDADGRMFVTDPGARCVHIFDREEREYDRITESAGGPFVDPVAVAFAADGRMFVSDAERRLVAVFDADGSPVTDIAEGFLRPTGIAVRGERLYVVDTGSHEVLVFTLDGRYLSRFGTRGSDRGTFNFPTSITAGNHLYLVDALNFRVQELSDSGQCLHTWGSQGGAQGQFASPKGVALDRDGHVYVTDALFDAFQIFDAEGRLLLVVGGRGDGPGRFWNPSGICIDAHDTVYVVDALNRRVQLFHYTSAE